MFLIYSIVILTLSYSLLTSTDVRNNTDSFTCGVEEHVLTFAYPPPTCFAGLIPPPLIFGAGIDSTCLFWSTECGVKGACLLYDNVAYRHLYVSLAIILKGIAFLLYTTTWYCLRRNYKKYIKSNEGHLSPTELFPSGHTLDNMGKDGSHNPDSRTKFIYNLEDHEWCENMESVL